MSSRSILVADEDIDTRIILRTLLERNGFSIAEATTADEAIVKASEHSYSLIILNHPMMTRSGTTLIQQLRADGAVVPILNITSRVIPQFLDDAMRQGVTMSMAKPINVEAVLAIVRELTRPALAVAN